MKLSLYYFRHNKNLACYTLTKSRIPFYDLTIVLDGTLNYTLNGKKYAVTKKSGAFSSAEHDTLQRERQRAI